MIRNYEDFLTELKKAGFSMGGGNSEGIFAVVPWDWKEEPPYETPVAWHSGNAETDPWEWRMRILFEERQIAYAKVFFRKSGYITKEWYPYFLAARREGRTLEEAYQEGTVSQEARRIYGCFSGEDSLPVHEIKRRCGVGRENKAAFERALTELQMKLFLTVCGRRQKVSGAGEEYGWSSNSFRTTEEFWGADVFTEAEHISKKEAEEAITEQIYRLNPEAQRRKIGRFIYG